MDRNDGQQGVPDGLVTLLTSLRCLTLKRKSIFGRQCRNAWERESDYERTDEVRRRRLEGRTMTEFCRTYGIARTTGYKWIGRYHVFGPAGRAPQVGCRIESFHMLRALLVLISFSILASGRTSKRSPGVLPQELVIGRDTFFDIGPPFHFLDVIVISSNGAQLRVSRILVTPPGDTCTQPAQVETKEATVSESIGSLLEGGNPCSIPESELHKEQKRCKHCLTFSGADVIMRVQCSGVTRHLRMDILDRDIYDSVHANTPTETSWTMRLLAKLDKVFGPGAMEKPIFSLGDPVSPPPQEDPLLRKLAAGDFDDLFPRTTLTVSAVYKQAMNPPPQPSVQVVSTNPSPSSSKTPIYPPLARAAHVSGRVHFTADIGTDGRVSHIRLEGHALLTRSVEEALSDWIYSDAAAGTTADGVIKFQNNCSSQTTR